jgi:hypothetical protein
MANIYAPNYDETVEKLHEETYDRNKEDLMIMAED